MMLCFLPAIRRILKHQAKDWKKFLENSHFLFPIIFLCALRNCRCILCYPAFSAYSTRRLHHASALALGEHISISIWFPIEPSALGSCAIQASIQPHVDARAFRKRDVCSVWGWGARRIYTRLVLYVFDGADYWCCFGEQDVLLHCLWHKGSLSSPGKLRVLW